MASSLVASSSTRDSTAKWSELPIGPNCWLQGGQSSHGPAAIPAHVLGRLRGWSGLVLPGGHCRHPTPCGSSGPPQSSREHLCTWSRASSSSIRKSSGARPCLGGWYLTQRLSSLLSASTTLKNNTSIRCATATVSSCVWRLSLKQAATPLPALFFQSFLNHRKLPGILPKVGSTSLFSHVSVTATMSALFRC